MLLRKLFIAAAVGTAIGSLPNLIIAILGTIGLGSGFIGIWDLIWLGYYAFTVTSTVLYRMRGIRIG